MNCHCRKEKKTHSTYLVEEGELQYVVVSDIRAGK